MARKKYEFTGETKEWSGITLRCIRAAIDFTLKSGIEIHKGDLGGWIEKESNLSHKDSAWVCGNAMVYGTAKVYGDAEVYGNASIYDNARVCGDAEVYDNAIVYDNARVCDNARVYGDAEVYGNAKVCGDARVFSSAEVFGNAKVIQSSDVICFKNFWSSGRNFTYTRSNGKWAVGCFYGTGEELIKKAYADSELKGKCYEATVKYVEELYKTIEAQQTDKNPKEDKEEKL